MKRTSDNVHHGSVSGLVHRPCGGGTRRGRQHLVSTWPSGVSEGPTLRQWSRSRIAPFEFAEDTGLKAASLMVGLLLPLGVSGRPMFRDCGDSEDPDIWTERVLVVIRRTYTSYPLDSMEVMEPGISVDSHSGCRQ